MSGANLTLPDSIKRYVEEVGAKINAGDVDAYGQLVEFHTKADRLDRLLTAWETQQNEERKLRKSYVKYLKWSLAIQGTLVNLAFFLIGVEVLEVEEWVAATFIGAVFAELTAMTFVVLRFLFPSSDTSPRQFTKLEK